MCRQSEKKFDKQQYLLDMFPQCGEFRPASRWDRSSIGAPQIISMAFASWLRYWSDVVQRKPTKLCTMFGRLLGCYAIYTFLGAVALWRKFATCNIHFASISLAFFYIGSFTARHSRSRRQPNFAAFNRGRHLYSTGRPSRWALAQILV